MPRVSAQQIDSDDEETAFFCLLNLLSLIRNTMSESGPRWMKVATPLVTSASWAARAERYFDMFGFQSENREGTRNKVFTGLGGNTVAAVGRRNFPLATFLHC